MKKHRIILGSVYCVFGGSIAFILLAIFINNLGELSPASSLPAVGQLIVGLIFFLASASGFYLARGRSWAYGLCYKLSFVWLLFIPVGTVLGLYYFWFNRKYIK